MKISIGSFIDQLSIINIRIWIAEDIKRKRGASDKEIADACRITNDANKQRNDLIEEIDKYFGIENRQGTNKIYGHK